MKLEIAASLAILEGELTRLDGLLAHDAGTGNPAVSVQLRDARQRLAKAADALRQAADDAAAPARSFDGVAPRAPGASLADRIVMIGAPAGNEPFRTKVKLKSTEALSEAPPADDLTRIRGIDRALAEHLARHDVRSFATIAAWGREDVHRIGEALGLGRQISRQNWIEQAALLRRHVAAPPPDQSAEPEPAPEPILPAAIEDAPAPAMEITEPAVTPPDRLDLIRGIDQACIAILHSAGIARWGDMVSWRRGDIDRIEGLLAQRGRIAKEGWIEQAALLAGGPKSAFAQRAIRGEFAALVPRPAFEPLSPPRFADWHAATIVAPPPDIPSPETAAATPLVVPAPAPAAILAPTQDIPASVALEQVLARAGVDTFDVPLSQLMPAQAVAHEPPLLVDLIADPGRELATLTAKDPPVVNHEPPFEHQPEPTPIVTARASRDRNFNIEDEEFEELNVSEADVVIVARPRPTRKPLPERNQPDSAARGLLARLKRSAPLDDIDPSTYAGYRDQVEEATVEIIKPGARIATTTVSETKSDGTPERPKKTVLRAIVNRSE
jgi:predicted flap endonuclease-1-like 5' DNA nuclease